ncbi:MAG TPA: HEAT repeat domain-containing protein [Vicinamibacterales bacterium]|nr:HEAT repeat domain-containing protein [Vicinamibacterales bacterium]
MTDRGHDRSLSALEQLADVRSSLSKELLAFLDAAHAALDATPWTHPHTQRRICATEVFVDLDVLTHAEDGEGSPSNRDRGNFTEADAARYELPSTTEGRHRTRWSQLLRTTRHVVVKGAPGSGKSFLTRHAAASRLRSAHDALQTRRVSLVNLPATLWVSATALASVNHVHAIGEALVEAAISSLELSPTGTAVREWLESAVLEGTTLILVDAVDEVSAEHYAACRQRLREAMSLPGQVIITCRTLQWELLKHELLPTTAYEEAELAPLTPVQVRSMLDRLSSNESHRTQLAALLNQNTALQRTCNSPLRLIFVHLLVNDGRLSAATTYAGLYMHLTRALLEGRWRTRRPRWALNPTRVERAIVSLAVIAWALFSSAPASNRFTLATWNAAARRFARMGASKEQFLEDLVELGLLVPAGFDDVGNRCWSFAHRTLLEYLAARELASRSTDEWVTEARSHLWYEPEWIEVLTFLSSIVPDATPLIIAVDCEKDDIWGSMLEFQSRIVGAARHVAPARARRLALKVFGLVLCSERFLEQPASIVFRHDYKEPVRALGSGHMHSLLTTALGSRSLLFRAAAVGALGVLGRKESIGPIVRVLQRDPTESTRFAAVHALRESKLPDTIEPLVEALQSNESSMIRRIAAYALEQLAEPAGHEGLLRALHQDPDPSVRKSAARALAVYSTGAVVQRLIDALQDDDEPQVRGAAASALAKIGDKRAIEPLIRALRGDTDASVRSAAAHSLGHFDRADVLAPLLEAWSGDDDPSVRSSASYALRRRGAVRILEARAEPLMHSLRDDPDPRNRLRAAAALRGLPIAAGALCEAFLEDSDKSVRKMARWLPDSNHHLFDDPDPVVRARQIRLLRGDLDANIVPDILRYIQGDFGLTAMLSRIPGSVHKVIDALCNSADPRVRRSAAYLLPLFARTLAERPLLTALKNDPDADIRREVVWALGSVATPAAVEALVDVALQAPIAKDSLQETAIVSLSRCRHLYRGRPLNDRALASLGWKPAAAVALNTLGVELRNRVQLNDARVMFHAALSLDRESLGWQHPKVPHRLMNLASAELLLGRLERARRLLHRAWRWQARGPDCTAARILTLRLVIAWSQKEPTSLYLGQLKSILQAGSLSNLADVHAYWSIDAVVRGLRERLSPQQVVLLKTLVAVLNGSQKASSLEECEEYRLQPLEPVEHPWNLPVRARADVGPQSYL